MRASSSRTRSGESYASVVGIWAKCRRKIVEDEFAGESDEDDDE